MISNYFRSTHSLLNTRILVSACAVCDCAVFCCDQVSEIIVIIVDSIQRIQTRPQQSSNLVEIPHDVILMSQSRHTQTTKLEF